MARSLLTSLSLRSLLFTLFHVFLGLPLVRLSLTLKVLHVLDQGFSSILSKRPKHCSLLSCKNSFMLFNFSLVLSFSAEILLPDLALDIHLTILTSFIPSLILFSPLTSQASFSYSTMLLTHAEYNLLFSLKGKPLLANKDTKSLNLLHLILLIKLPTVPTASPIVSPRWLSFSTVSRDWPFNSVPGKSSAVPVCCLNLQLV